MKLPIPLVNSLPPLRKLVSWKPVHFALWRNDDDQLHTQAHTYIIWNDFRTLARKISTTKQLDAFYFSRHLKQMISLLREENDSPQVSM